MTRARSSTRISSLLALVLTVATGCEIDMKLGELDDTSTSAAASDDMGDSSGGATSAASGNSGVAEGTSTDGSETGSDTDETAAEACLPLPEELSFWVDFDAEQPDFDTWELHVDADCTVASVADDDVNRLYTIECDEGGEAPVPRLLEVMRSSGAIDLPMAAGTPIHVQVAKNYPIDTGGWRYIVVRDAAGELILGYYGSNVVPDDLGIDVDAWFAPLAFQLAFGDCAPEPYEEPGSTFIVDPCPAVETRLAVSFQLGDESAHVLDRTSGQLGPLSLFVTGARHLDPVGECTFPIDAFSFVTFREE